MRYTDELYPANIARCQHIKVNGTLCGSPALKHKRHCFFHHQWQQNRIQLNANQARRGGAPLAFELPILEDANSIQVALMQVMRLLLTGAIEHRTAALLLYALQTASSNLSRTEFKPRPEEVVIDKSAIPDTLLGDSAWYKQEFVDLQDEDESEDNEEDTDEEDSEEEEGTIQAVGCDSTRNRGWPSIRAKALSRQKYPVPCRGTAFSPERLRTKALEISRESPTGGRSFHQPSIRPEHRP